MNLHKQLFYPVFLIEETDTNKFTGFNIVKGLTGFTTWTRIPVIGKYSRGQVFAADGKIYWYCGDSGFFRFSEKVCMLLEILMLPTIFSKMFESLVYHGPKLASVETVGLVEFKEAVLLAVKRYGSSDLEQLFELVEPCGSFEEVIRSIDWWRFHGGRHDEDGHPLES